MCSHIVVKSRQFRMTVPFFMLLTFITLSSVTTACFTRYFTSNGENHNPVVGGRVFIHRFTGLTSEC